MIGVTPIRNVRPDFVLLIDLLENFKILSVGVGGVRNKNENKKIKKTSVGHIKVISHQKYMKIDIFYPQNMEGRQNKKFKSKNSNCIFLEGLRS